MKKIMMAMGIVAALSFLVSMIAVAPLVANEKINYGQTPKQSPAKIPPKIQTPKTDKAVGLKFTKLNPRDLVGAKSPKALGSKFYVEWKKITDAYQLLVTNIPKYEEAAKKYAAKSEECKNKSYTQEDMTAAGCQPSDSVTVCSQKLFQWCTLQEHKAVDNATVSCGVNLTTLQGSSKKAWDELYESAYNVLH